MIAHPSAAHGRVQEFIPDWFGLDVPTQDMQAERPPAEAELGDALAAELDDADATRDEVYFDVDAEGARPRSPYHRRLARWKLRKRREDDPDSPALFCERVRVVRYLAPGGPTLAELEAWPAELVSLLALESARDRGQADGGYLPDAEEIAEERAAARRRELRRLSQADRGADRPRTWQAEQWREGRRLVIREAERRERGPLVSDALDRIMAEVEQAGRVAPKPWPVRQLQLFDVPLPERGRDETARLARRARLSLARLERLVGLGQVAVSRRFVKAARTLAGEAAALRNTVDPDRWRVRRRRRRSGRKVKPEVRQSAFEATAGRCAYCGRPADTLDHVEPRSQGGSNTQENLAPACRHCNQAKADRTPQKWAQDIIAATEKAGSAG